MTKPVEVVDSREALAASPPRLLASSACHGASLHRGPRRGRIGRVARVATEDPVPTRRPGELDDAAQLGHPVRQLLAEHAPRDGADDALVDDDQRRRHAALQQYVDDLVDAGLEVGPALAARKFEAQIRSYSLTISPLRATPQPLLLMQAYTLRPRAARPMVL